MQPRLEVLNLNMFLKAGAFPSFLKNYEKLKYDMIMVERSWNCFFLFMFLGCAAVPPANQGSSGVHRQSEDGSVTVLAKFSNSSWDLLGAWLVGQPANQQWLEDMRTTGWWFQTFFF